MAPKEKPQHSKSLTKSLKIDAEGLSYQTMTVHDCGTMVSREEKECLRNRYGYCTTCPGVPVLIFNVSRSRLNLFSKKEPRTAEGECLNGVCLHCHPTKDSRRQKFAAMKSSGNSFTQSKKEIQRDLSNGALAMSQSRRDLFERDPSNANFSRMSSRRDLTKDDNSDSAASPRLGRKSPQQSPRLSDSRKSPEQGSAYEIGSTSSSANSPCFGSRKSPQPSLCFVDSRESLQQSYDSDTGSLNSSFTSSSLGRSPQPSPQFVVRKSIQSSPSLGRKTFEQAGRERLPLPTSPPPPPEDDESSATGLSPSSATQPCLGVKRSSSIGTPSKQDDASTELGLRESKSSSWVPSSGYKKAIVGAQTKDTMHYLESLIEDLGSVKDFDFLLQVVVNAMQSYRQQEPVLLLCLEAITKMCKQSEKINNYALSQSKLPEEIILAMKNFNTSREVHVRAGNAIACLASSTNMGSALVEQGACHLLVKALQMFSEVFSVVAAAVAALRGLSLEPSSRELFHLIMASKFVIETMGKYISMVSLQRDGCAFLSNVSVDIHSEKVSTVSRDLLCAIVGALKKHHENEALISIACFALRNLTCEKNNLRILRGIEGIFSLFEPPLGSVILSFQDSYDILERLQMSQAEDESLEDQAKESLQVLIALRDGAPEMITDVKDLIKNFDWSPSVLMECLESLATLATMSREHKAVLLRDDCLRYLIDVVTAHKMDLGVLEKSIRLFEALSEDDDSVKRVLLESDVWRTILNAIGGDHHKTLEVGSIETGVSVLNNILSLDDMSLKLHDREKITREVRFVMEAQKRSIIVQSYGEAILSRFDE